MSVMYLVLSPADIFALTDVRIHEVGEVMVLMGSKKTLVLCDPRTTGLFSDRFETYDTKLSWKRLFHNLGSLATDPLFLTHHLGERLKKLGATFSFRPSPVTTLRMRKTSQELEMLRQSQERNKNVYDMIISRMHTGMTEKECARMIRMYQLEVGFSGPSFDPIVAFGTHTAIPHHIPTDRRLAKNDPVLIDMGGVYGGYCSDMTRCHVYGSAGGSEYLELYVFLQSVVQKIITSIRPGVTVSSLDKQARVLLGSYAKYFTHSLGHGVGIEIHEAPFLSRRSRAVLDSGMVVTIEPGIYMPGVCGLRYEDMVVVSDEGCYVL